MSVAPITPQEVNQLCSPQVPDEICEIINELLVEWWNEGQSETRINVKIDIIEGAFLRCVDDKEKTCLLREFFARENWHLRVKSYYEAVGWKVKYDYIIDGVPRFVFRMA